MGLNSNFLGFNKSNDKKSLPCLLGNSGISISNWSISLFGLSESTSIRIGPDSGLPEPVGLSYNTTPSSEILFT